MLSAITLKARYFLIYTHYSMISTFSKYFWQLSKDVNKDKNQFLLSVKIMFSIDYKIVSNADKFTQFIKICVLDRFYLFLIVILLLTLDY